MKLKFFLRGLGIGILVTASILTISHRAQDKQQTLTNEQIVERAQELGMILPEESQSPQPSASLEPSETSTSTPTVVPSPTMEASPTVTPSPTAEPKEAVTPSPTAEPSATPKATPTATPKKAEETKKTEKAPTYVSVTIEKGMWSETVSRKMEEAGLVKSADDFNVYLMNNGYSSLISVGTYKIQKGATYQEIAEKIAGK